MAVVPQDKKPLNVMIVDDTITYRAILKETLAGLDGVQSVAMAKNGQEALEKLDAFAKEQTPIDMVLLDVEMPVMNGIETLQQIRRRFPKVQVVMVSGVDPNSANTTFHALESGALDFVAKPSEGTTFQNIQNLRNKLVPLFQHVHASMAHFLPARSSVPPVQKPVVNHAPPLAQLPKTYSTIGFKPSVLAIGVSTGGPNALKALLPKLPGNLGLPVVVVIHMPEVFTGYLADSLNRLCALTVCEARDGDVLKPNTVYIAPGGRHMVLERHGAEVAVATNLNPPENSCRPAVDVLFRSVASVYGTGILNVVLTGMGNDGQKGVQAIRQRQGNITLTQSAESCVVYGMPKAVDDAGLSDESLSLEDISHRITHLTSSLLFNKKEQS
ncbi:MAG: chemotaxis-specific protein-glutamate methyltransferase CheB [Vampirovibrionales bacterium]